MRDWLDIVAMILMLLAGISLLAYGILKAIGIINTPVWILAIPYVAGGVALLSVVLYFGRLIEKVDRNCKVLKGYERMKDDFVVVRDRQKMCLSGEMKGSPYL